MIYLNKKPLLEESFNSFVRSIDIVYTLTENYSGTYTRPSGAGNNNNNNNRDNNSNRGTENPWVSKMLDSHYTDIKDLKKTTNDLRDLISSTKSQSQYEKEIESKKFDDLKNVSYEPLRITKKNRPFTSYPFPMNILYLAKQIFI